MHDQLKNMDTSRLVKEGQFRGLYAVRSVQEVADLLVVSRTLVIHYERRALKKLRRCPEIAALGEEYGLTEPRGTP